MIEQDPHEVAQQQNGAASELAYIRQLLGRNYGIDVSSIKRVTFQGSLAYAIANVNLEPPAITRLHATLRMGLKNHGVHMLKNLIVRNHIMYIVLQ